MKNNVLDVLCCKWEEMEYISQVISFILSYMVPVSSPSLTRRIATTLLERRKRRLAL